MAQLKLQPYFQNEVEDVAIEALEELVEKVRELTSFENSFPIETDLPAALAKARGFVQEQIKR